MKKQIIYLATLATLTVGGAFIANKANHNFIGTSVAHAGTAGFNINCYVDNHRWTFNIVYWDDSSQTYKTDVLGSYNDLANDINNAPARNENNPQNNTGFNVDSDGTYWYRNYDSRDTQDYVKTDLNEYRYFTLPNGTKVDATDNSTTSQAPGGNNQSDSSSDTTNSNTASDSNNQTTTKDNSNQKKINQETKLLDQAKNKLKHAKSKRAKKAIKKQVAKLKARLKPLKKN